MDYYVIMNGIIQDVTVNFPNNIYSLGQCSQMHIKEVILDAVNNFDYGGIFELFFIISCILRLSNEY